MGVKLFKDLNLTEEQIGDLANFFRKYTEAVIQRVLIERKFNTEVCWNLLRELHIREDQERLEFERNLKYIIEYQEKVEDMGSRINNLRNHCLTHSDSYRDVLYDMIVREEKTDGK